jgi:hypothetical protein
MNYLYHCEVCQIEINKDFKIGTAPKKIKCQCGGSSYRKYQVSAVISSPTHPARKGRGRG